VFLLPSTLGSHASVPIQDGSDEVTNLKAQVISVKSNRRTKKPTTLREHKAIVMSKHKGTSMGQSRVVI